MKALYRFQFISPQNAALYENVEVFVVDTSYENAKKQAQLLIKGLKYAKCRLMTIQTVEASTQHIVQEATAKVTGSFSDTSGSDLPNTSPDTKSRKAEAQK